MKSILVGVIVFISSCDENHTGKRWNQALETTKILISSHGNKDAAIITILIKAHHTDGRYYSSNVRINIMHPDNKSYIIIQQKWHQKQQCSYRI